MVIAHYKQSTATVVKMIKRWVEHKAVPSTGGRLHPRFLRFLSP